ncbi:Chymotrypsin-like elastase family member 1 [Chionoecetes opilio]|uniref:Chymotrypsin-like elastase family member 1 n=1 Tax=Chionoecetes opilio TaxID=41210 RepID=A0A8J5CRS7_CHIOP|nr:Chymotrypsin-like elastase family member 1 [Chionoecetes opilio]
MLHLALLLLALLNVSLAEIANVVADCTTFRRCRCGEGVAGGTATPALARLTNTKTNKRCAAVLINDRYLLSSADCDAGLIDESQVYDETFVTFYNSEQALHVDRLYVHHHHVAASVPRLYDIMLVRLRYLVDMSVHVPICLPHASLLLYDDTPAWIMGPGKGPVSVMTHTGNCSFTHQVDGPVRTIRVRPGMYLCAGRVDTPFCSLEPGFLLVVRVHGWYMVVGVASTLELFPMCTYSMGLFSEVLPHRGWIKNMTSDASGCQFDL